MASRKEFVSNLNIKIGPLDEKDIEKFDQILRQHVRSRDTGEILEDEISEIKGYMRGNKDDYGRLRKYLVAKSFDDGVIGCMAYSVMDPDMVSHFPDIDQTESVELLNAFVSSEVFRGGGVGGRLFESICNAARLEGKKHLVVHSGPRYKASWGFYDKKADENRGYILEKYGKGGDAMTWVKKL
jgi:predicted N-acetyltransferase YhbS